MSDPNQITKKLSELLDSNRVTWNQDGDSYEFSIQDYGANEKQTINFHHLMEVGKIFGTLDFDFSTQFEPGREWSEYTKDSDQVIKTYRVAIDKLDSGLPWGNK